MKSTKVHPPSYNYQHHLRRYTTHPPRMGNCYGEDGDSEDEYYGYYGKNNRLKPKPNPTPPEPYLQQESESEEDKGYELEGLEYEDDEGERYKLEYEGDEEELAELGPEDEEVKVNEHGVHEHNHLVYDDSETRELEELERMVNEEGYEPQGLEYGLDLENGKVYHLGELEHEPQEPYELEYKLEDRNMDAHYGTYEPRTLESSGVPQRAEPKYEGPG